MEHVSYRRVIPRPPETFFALQPRFPTLRYVYTPLNGPDHMVRLFRFSVHGQWELQPFRLDACPPFNALSYTWGSNRHKDHIIVNSRILPVSPNLGSFLKTRYPQTGWCWWWIDQISIDQDREEERSMQVSIMADIYQKASHVFVWLDGLPNRTCRALSVELAGDNVKLETLKRFDDDIVNLLEHRYWSRIWIVQELLFAQKVEVVYGSSSISIKHLQNIIRHYRCVSASPTQRASKLIQLATSLSGNASKGLLSLSGVIASMTSGRCSDVRDTIFGIQGILKSEFRQRVDYNKKAGEVFLDTVHILVETWPKEQSTSNLLSICLKLGEMMLPDLLSLHRLVQLGLSDTLQKIVEVQKLPQNEAEKAKEQIVAIFVDVVSSSGQPAQAT